MAFDFEKARAAANHAVQLIREESDRLVGFIRRNGGIHIGAMDFNMPLGREAMFRVLIGIAFDFYANPHDLFFVAKESFGFVVDECFEGRSEIQVDAGDYQFVSTIIIHLILFPLVELTETVADHFA